MNQRGLNGRHGFVTRGSRQRNPVSWPTKGRPCWTAPSSIGVKRAERSHALPSGSGRMRFIEISIHREEPERSAAICDRPRRDRRGCGRACAFLSRTRCKVNFLRRRRSTGRITCVILAHGHHVAEDRARVQWGNVKKASLVSNPSNNDQMHILHSSGLAH